MLLVVVRPDVLVHYSAELCVDADQFHDGFSRIYQLISVRRDGQNIIIAVAI